MGIPEAQFPAHHMIDAALYTFGVLLNTAVLTALTVATGRLLILMWSDAQQ